MGIIFVAYHKLPVLELKLKILNFKYYFSGLIVSLLGCLFWLNFTLAYQMSLIPPLGLILLVLGNIFLIIAGKISINQSKYIRRKLGRIKILKALPELEPNIPIAITRFSLFAKTSIPETEMILKTILMDQPKIGKYMELEQIFRKNDETSTLIDELLLKYEKGVKSEKN